MNISGQFNDMIPAEPWDTVPGSDPRPIFGDTPPSLYLRFVKIDRTALMWRLFLDLLRHLGRRRDGLEDFEDFEILMIWDLK